MKYAHGGDVHTARRKNPNIEIVDFSANINPLGLPEGVVAALKNAAGSIVDYPDPYCTELAQAISEFEKVPAEYILCGNGAADLIFRIAAALRPKCALMLAPTFSEYEIAARSAGCAVKYHMLKPEDEFQPGRDILDELERCNADMLFLCNPNNPTGHVIEPQLMSEILSLCGRKEIYAVVDECFMDFIENDHLFSVKSKLAKYPKLIIIKAFTKLFAMPGIRLGYVICSSEFVRDKLQVCAQPWSVSGLAQTAGTAALKQKDFKKQTKDFVRAQREYLKRELRAFGFCVIGSQANYIFFKTTEHTDIKALLEPYGILVRSCSNYMGLDADYFRIAVKNHEQNEFFIRTLKKLFGNRRA